MTYYRFDPLRPDGHFLGPPTEVECADDEEALQMAKRALDGLDVEVWERGRLVARLSHKDHS